MFASRSQSAEVDKLEKNMIEVSATPAFHTTWPDAVVGVMAVHGIENPDKHAALNAEKARLEAELRDRYAGQNRADLRAQSTLAAYERYYRRFGNTYHVQLQLESVALKGKPIASVSALVEAMFMSELETGLLTAVHDLDTLSPPLTIDVARDTTTYVTASGKEATLKQDDIHMTDADGVVCSILYGQDARTRVTSQTTNALFVVYAPPGILREEITRHFALISRLAGLFSPNATSLEPTLFVASGDVR